MRTFSLKPTKQKDLSVGLLSLGRFRGRLCKFLLDPLLANQGFSCVEESCVGGMPSLGVPCVRAWPTFLTPFFSATSPPPFPGLAVFGSRLFEWDLRLSPDFGSESPRKFYKKSTWCLVCAATSVRIAASFYWAILVRKEMSWNPNRVEVSRWFRWKSEAFHCSEGFP